MYGVKIPFMIFLVYSLSSYCDYCETWGHFVYDLYDFGEGGDSGVHRIEKAIDSIGKAEGLLIQVVRASQINFRNRDLCVPDVGEFDSLLQGVDGQASSIKSLELFRGRHGIVIYDMIVYAPIGELHLTIESEDEACREYQVRLIVE